MPAATKFQDFVRQILSKEHNLNADAITLALTNTAPVVGNSYMSSITEIVYTGATGSRILGTKTLTQAAGVAKFVADDVVLTGTGAGFGPFRYLVLFNDTPSTSATKGLICFIDYGSSISVGAGEIFTTDFDQVNGIFTLGP